MTKTELMNKASRTFYKVGFQLKKHSPEILAVGGAVGAVASTVWACKQTTKLGGILEESKAAINQIHEVMENPDLLPEGADYDIEKDGKKVLTIVYTQAAVKVIKLYAGPVILGTLSLTAMLTSNNILRKRNMALVAAYTAVDKGFKEYRSRVVERFGEEIDKELRYNVKAKEVTETVTNEDGTETEVTKTVEVAEDSALHDYSQYARIYDCGCKGWTKDPDTNKAFLLHTQAMLNDRLQTVGYVFLNEVYEALGFQRSSAGQVVGWIYGNGDNKIDFGIWDANISKNRDFVNGYERNIVLDFNVDGPIWDKI